ncbi:unnamed protein product [Rotaria sp. Silwood1]|nr:unnamed protein product [Rotaria sp. Silwood1]
MGTNGDVKFSVDEQSEAIRWGTVVYQCFGKENVNDVKKLEWNKITRKLPGQHGYGFYTSFYYDEEGSEPEQYETNGWTK